MKLHKVAALAAVAGFGIAAAFAPAMAEGAPQLKAPTKTMGNEGKLPSTDTVGGHVPNMGSMAPDEALDGTSGPMTPKGPTKRMGDQGTLPATGTMGGAVPDMSTGQ